MIRLPIERMQQRRRQSAGGAWVAICCAGLSVAIYVLVTILTWRGQR